MVRTVEHSISNLFGIEALTVFAKVEVCHEQCESVLAAVESSDIENFGQQEAQVRPAVSFELYTFRVHRRCTIGGAFCYLVLQIHPWNGLFLKIQEIVI